MTDENQTAASIPEVIQGTPPQPTPTMAELLRAARAVQTPTTPPPNIYIAPHIAGNIVEMLKRVQVTGFEAFALVEIVQLLTPIAAPAPQGPGVPFAPR